MAADRHPFRAACAGLALLALTACSESLYDGLSQRSANEIVAVLTQNGINATRSGSGDTYAVSVDAADIGRATAILDAAGLPRDDHQSVTDLFPGDRMIITPFEQQARMEFALGQELSKTIEQISGVSAARVHVVLPRRDLRDRIVSDASAAVVIHAMGAVEVPVLNERVRSIVANAVPSLSVDRVAITNFSVPLAADPMMTSTLAKTGTTAASASALSGLERWFFALAVAAMLAALGYILVGLFKRSSA